MFFGFNLKILVASAIAVLAFFQWFLDSLFKEKPNLKKTVKVISFLVAVLGILSVFLDKHEQQVQEIKELKAQNEILELKQDNLKLKMKLATVDKNLKEESDKLKNVVGTILIDFSGNWNENTKPFSNEVIPNYIDQITILNLFPFPEKNLTGFKLNLIEMYRFLDLGQGKARLIANVKVNENAGILHFPKSAMQIPQNYIVYLPLASWNKNNYQPITLDRVSVQIRLNNESEIKFEKLPNQLKNTEYNNGQPSYFVWHQGSLSREDLKIKRIK